MFNLDWLRKLLSIATVEDMNDILASHESTVKSVRTAAYQDCQLLALRLSKSYRELGVKEVSVNTCIALSELIAECKGNHGSMPLPQPPKDK